METIETDRREDATMEVESDMEVDISESDSDEVDVDPIPCSSWYTEEQNIVSSNQYVKEHKVLISGISMDATEDDLKSYFERYGVVVKVVFIVNRNDTSRPHKGFGFVTYEDESSVDQACAKHYHVIKDKRVEAKKAE